MATHSSILARRMLWTEQPSGLQSMGSPRIGQERSDLARTHAFIYIYSERERQEKRPKNTDIGDPPIQMVQTAHPTVKSIVKTLLVCSQVHHFQSFGCLLPNMN